MMKISSRPAKWLIGVVFSLASLTLLIFIVSKGVADSLLEKEYATYIIEYMPDEKQITGKWPADLHNLPQYIIADIKGEEAGGVTGSLKRIQSFSSNHRCSLHILSQTNETVTYILNIDGTEKKYKVSAKKK